MTYKLVVLDIDDSLMTYGSSITAYTREVIKAVYDKGVKIVLASGRMYPSIAQVGKDLNITMAAAIALNGALVMDTDGRQLWHCPIDQDTAVSFVEENSHEAPHFFFTTYDTFYLDRREPLFLDTKAFVVYKEDLNVFLRQQKHTIYELGFYDVDTKVMPHLHIGGKRHNKSYYIKVRGPVVKLMQKNISKGRCVHQLAVQWGIKREEILVVGDEANDISMFWVAGMAIATGNAKRFVHPYVNYITKSSAKEGVARALEKFIL